jgi:hypothetical protein
VGPVGTPADDLPLETEVWWAGDLRAALPEAA